MNLASTVVKKQLTSTLGKYGDEIRSLVIDELVRINPRYTVNDVEAITEDGGTFHYKGRLLLSVRAVERTGDAIQVDYEVKA